MVKSELCGDLAKKHVRRPFINLPASAHLNGQPLGAFVVIIQSHGGEAGREVKGMATGIGTVFEINDGTVLSGAGSNGTTVFGANQGLIVHSAEFTWGLVDDQHVHDGESFVLDSNGDGSYANDPTLTITGIERYFGKIEFSVGSFTTDTNSPGYAFSVITTNDGRQFVNLPTFSVDAIDANGTAIVAFHFDTYTSAFENKVHTDNYINDHAALIDPRNFIVEGTSGNDRIDANYTDDPHGDRVDAADNGYGDTVGNNNDVISAGDGNDTVIAGDGRDTVYGDGGDDLISGGGSHDLLDGGDGSDTLLGGAGNDTFVVSDGHDTIRDFLISQSVAANDGIAGNNDLVDLSDYYNQTNYDAAVAAGHIDPNEIANPLQWLKSDYVDDGVLNDMNAGWTATSSLRLESQGEDIALGSLRSETTGVVCFTGETEILTANGPKRADKLKVGDLIHTVDPGLQPIRWIGIRTLDVEYLQKNENQRPIKIDAHALGDNIPEKPLSISPQHRILIKSKIVERVTDVPEVLVPAKALVCVDGVDIDSECGVVTYVHFLFDQHELVIANGVHSESLFLGKMSIANLGDEALNEINSIFPEVRMLDRSMQLCRVELKYQAAIKVAARHAEKGRFLVDVNHYEPLQ